MFKLEDVREEIRPATAALIADLQSWSIPIDPYICEDESVMIEWYSKSWRMGFFTDIKPSDCGWYLVTNGTFGDLQMQGALHSSEMYEMIKWGLEHQNE